MGREGKGSASNVFGKISSAKFFFLR